VRVSLLVFQQFLLLLVQPVFDEENLRHVDVVIARSRSDEFFAETRKNTQNKKKLYIRNENQPLCPRMYDPLASLSAAPVRCVKSGSAARPPLQQSHNDRSFCTV